MKCQNYYCDNRIRVASIGFREGDCSVDWTINRDYVKACETRLEFIKDFCPSQEEYEEGLKVKMPDTNDDLPF